MEFVLEPTDITRELILRKVSEENIMEHYLGVRVQKGLFKSPFRAEKQPSCCFYRSNKTGRLLFKDFGSDDLFDCVSVVMYKHSCSYYHALQIIANDFNIISKKRLIKNEPLIKYSNTKLEETGDAVIQVEIKDFDQHELNWWSKFGISAETLHKFKVFSCKNVFLNGNLFSLYKENQLIFGYYGGIREDIER